MTDTLRVAKQTFVSGVRAESESIPDVLQSFDQLDLDFRFAETGRSVTRSDDDSQIDLDSSNFALCNAYDPANTPITCASWT